MATTETAVQIPGVQKKVFHVTIKGISPLLSNKFSDVAKKQMLDKQMKKAVAAKEAKDPVSCYENSIYYTDDGRPGFPASAIKKACVGACRFLDMKMTEARGAFYIMGDILPIDGAHEMHEAIVRLQGRTADLRYRAIFKDWSITATVMYNPRVISQESIVNLLETAGFHIGIGDWRPEKDGTMGMFEVAREEL